jgi:hypothetical protein
MSGYDYVPIKLYLQALTCEFPSFLATKHAFSYGFSPTIKIIFSFWAMVC